jgi:hypothetical protein
VGAQTGVEDEGTVSSTRSSPFWAAGEEAEDRAGHRHRQDGANGEPSPPPSSSSEPWRAKYSVYCRAADGKWAGWSAALQQSAVEVGIVPIDVEGDVGGTDYNAFDYGR